MVQNQPYILQLWSSDLDSLITVYSWPEQVLVNIAVNQIQLYAKKCTGAFHLLPPPLQDPGQSELPKTKKKCFKPWEEWIWWCHLSLMHLVLAESLTMKSYEIHYWQGLFQTQKRADILHDMWMSYILYVRLPFRARVGAFLFSISSQYQILTPKSFEKTDCKGMQAM